MNEEKDLETTDVIQQTEQAEQTTQSYQESAKEQNFKIMRERAEAAERRAMELERNYASQQQKSRPQDEDDLDIIAPDEGFLEPKVWKNNQRKVIKAQKQTSEELQEMKNMMAEMKLQSKYPDYYAVVTDENLEKLKRTKPSHARSIYHNPDMFDKGELAYEAIKSTMTTEKYVAQDRKLEENKLKPRSSPSGGHLPGAKESSSPLARLQDYDPVAGIHRRVLTADQKKEVQKQQAERRKYSSY